MVKLKTPFSHELAKARSARIKGLRKALRISAAKLCKKYSDYGLTESGLSGWENIRWHGLTENGAHILAAVFQAEGLNVTVEWLLFGAGESPIPNSFLFSKTTQKSEEELIKKELTTFIKNYPETLDAIVNDDSMVPFLQAGDVVAGVCYSGHDIEKAIGKISIVELENKQRCVKMVKAGSDLGLYKLSSTNTGTNPENKESLDIKLSRVAPIIWIRKSQITK